MDLFLAKDLRDVVVDSLKDMRLLVLAACHSEAIVEEANIDCVPSIICVPAERKVSDELCGKFSSELYRHLLQGAAVGDAFSQASTACRNAPFTLRTRQPGTAIATGPGHSEPCFVFEGAGMKVGSQSEVFEGPACTPEMGNLPDTSTCLVAPVRQHQLLRAMNLARAVERVCALSVYGPAGIGKSKAAIDACRYQAQRDPERVLVGVRFPGASAPSTGGAHEAAAATRRPVWEVIAEAVCAEWRREWRGEEEFLRSLFQMPGYPLLVLDGVDAWLSGPPSNQLGEALTVAAFVQHARKLPEAQGLIIATSCEPAVPRDHAQNKHTHLVEPLTCVETASLLLAVDPQVRLKPKGQSAGDLPPIPLGGFLGRPQIVRSAPTLSKLDLAREPAVKQCAGVPRAVYRLDELLHKLPEHALSMLQAADLEQLAHLAAHGSPEDHAVDTRKRGVWPGSGARAGAPAASFPAPGTPAPAPALLWPWPATSGEAEKALGLAGLEQLPRLQPHCEQAASACLPGDGLGQCIWLRASRGAETATQDDLRLAFMDVFGVFCTLRGHPPRTLSRSQQMGLRAILFCKGFAGVGDTPARSEQLQELSESRQRACFNLPVSLDGRVQHSGSWCRMWGWLGPSVRALRGGLLPLWHDSQEGRACLLPFETTVTYKNLIDSCPDPKAFTLGLSETRPGGLRLMRKPTSPLRCDRLLPTTAGSYDQYQDPFRSRTGSVPELLLQNPDIDTALPWGVPKRQAVHLEPATASSHASATSPMPGFTGHPPAEATAVMGFRAPGHPVRHSSRLLG